jgi:signal peptidase II
MSRIVAGATVRRWIALFGIAGIVVVLDQASKAWVLANFELGVPTEIVGDWLRIWYIQNAGALFGLFQQSAVIFGIVSLVVIGVILWIHARMAATGGWITTLGLGLLLGGAVGNVIDRFRFGYVVDFVDIGIGGWRFFTFNIADACIDIGILILIVVALVPAIPARLGGSPAAAGGEGPAAGGTTGGDGGGASGGGGTAAGGGGQPG